MRYLYLLLISLFSIKAIAQQHFPHSNKNAIDSFKGVVYSRVMSIPLWDTASSFWDSTHCLWFRPSDSGLYFSNGGASRVKVVVGGTAGTGTVTSISTNGGILGGTITTTGTLYADTVTKLVTNTRLKDSAAVFEHTSNKVTSFASPNNTTYPTTSAVNTLVASYLLKSDTAAMLAPYVRVNRFTDSISTLRLLSNAKVNYTDTGNMLLPYLRIPDTTGNTGKVLTKGSSSIYWGALSVVGSLQSSDASLNITPPTGAVDATLNTTKGFKFTGIDTFTQRLRVTAPINTTALALDTTTTTTATEGQIVWNSTDKTIEVPLSQQVTMQVGQEMYIRCVNKTGVTIPNGKAVYVNDAHGNRPTMTLAQANTTPTSMVIGVTTEDIAANAEGFVTTNGIVNNIDTRPFTTDGQALYLSADSAGVITKTVPSSPNNVIFIGHSLNTTTSGSIYVHIGSPISNDSTFESNGTIAPTNTAVYKFTRKILSDTASSLRTAINAKGSGTVTTVNSGYGIVTTTITTTGTISVDTGVMATRLRVQKGVDSLNAVSATKVSFTDTTYTIGTKAWRQKGIDSINATAVFPSTTQTLTNKRITFRVTGGSSFTTSVTINADASDVWEDSLQAGALLFNAPSGTPTNHQLLEIVIKDNGTARALTWNTIFSASTDLALPTTTTLSKWLYMLFQYNSRSGKWYLLSKLDNFTP